MRVMPYPQTPGKPIYCYPCDDLVMPVTTDENEFAGHCPICQRHPSILERSLHTYPNRKMREKLRRQHEADR